MHQEFESLQDLTNRMRKMTILELRELARDFYIIPRNLPRSELVRRITASYKGELEPEIPVKSGRPTKKAKLAQMEKLIEDGMADNVGDEFPHVGTLEILPDGCGFVRTENYSSHPGKDYHVSEATISKANLRSGDKVKVVLHQFPDRAVPTVVHIKEINDQPCEEINRVPFDSLEPCFPKSRIVLESERTDYALRALSLVAPIGKGQRGLIVAPPKTGKTILLKKIAMAVRKNHPEIKLTVLLIDERPEEVTDFKESVDCDVVYSTFDQSPQSHIRLAELVFINARRRVEQGQDVMILLDSITRLSRAYNQMATSSKTPNADLDITALQEPKRMFGLGRNTKTGGSLTVLATALVNTGSAMDDAIYEAFKDTINMEIQLDRRMSEKRIYPAIDLNRSGTRREELLLNQTQLEGMYLTRRLLAGEDSITATESLLEVIMTTDNNDQAIEALKILVKNEQARRENQ